MSELEIWLSRCIWCGTVLIEDDPYCPTCNVENPNYIISRDIDEPEDESESEARDED